MELKDFTPTFVMKDLALLANKINKLLRLCGFTGIGDRTTKVYSCDLKKQPDFMDKFNKITGLSLVTVDSAVHQFKDMLDEANISYTCGRSTKSTYFQLVDPVSDELDLIPVGDYLFARSEEHIGPFGSNKSDYTCGIYTVVPKFIKSPIDSTFDKYVITAPCERITSVCICVIGEYDCQFSPPLPKGLPLKVSDIRPIQIAEGQYYFDLPDCVDNHINLVPWQTYYGNISMLTILVTGVSDTLPATGSRVARSKEQSDQFTLIPLNGLTGGDEIHYDLVGDTPYVHRISVFQSCITTAKLVLVPAHTGEPKTITYTKELLQLASSRAVCHGCIVIPFSDNSVRGHCYLDLQQYTKATLVLSKLEMGEHSKVYIEHATDVRDVTDLADWVRVNCSKYTVTTKPQVVSCSNLFYVIDSRRTSKEMANRHFQKYNLETTAVRGCKMSPEYIVFTLTPHLPLLYLENAPHGQFYYSGTEERCHVALRCLIEKHHAYGPQGAFVFSNNITRAFNPDSTQIGKSLSSFSVCSPELRQRSEYALLIGQHGKLQHYSIPNGAIGNVTIKSAGVKEVVFSIGGAVITRLEARFVDFSKPLPLFVGLHDVLSLTNKEHIKNTHNLLPFLRWHQVKVEFITNEPHAVDVEFDAEIYEINEGYMEKPLEWLVINRAYLTLASKLEQSTCNTTQDLTCNTTQTHTYIVLNFSHLTTQIQVLFERHEPRSQSHISCVSLKLNICDETVEIPLKRKSDDSSMWSYIPPVDHTVSYAYQFANLSRVDAELVVVGTNYDYIHIEQQHINGLRFAAGMAGMVYCN